MLWQIDPWQEMERMSREMNRILGSSGRTAPSSFPLVNVYESKDDVVVTAELPGCTKECVNITFADGALTLSGKQEPVADENKMILIRQERSLGEFEKTLNIPYKIDQEKISAAFKNGVLTVTLPKAEEAKPKQISIDVK